MRKVLLSGALALIGLAAPAASVLAPPPPLRRRLHGMRRPPRRLPDDPCPGLYHVPIIGKATLPGVLGSLLGGGTSDGLRRATAVSSSNWSATRTRTTPSAR